MFLLSLDHHEFENTRMVTDEGANGIGISQYNSKEPIGPKVCFPFPSPPKENIL